MSAPLRPLALTLTAAGLASACSAADPDMPDHHDYGDEPLGVTSAALSDDDPVSTAVKQSCTTASVKGLAVQLVKEIDCLRPNTMKKIAGISGVELGTAAAGVPFLQTPAADALVAAQKARGKTIHINSGLRTLPQQYLLYRWYKTGRCGIGLAASPGTSNHESGLAVDIEDNAGWRSAMQAHDFKWLGASDPVHYDFVGAGAVDLKGLSVKAFQRLWNRNHADDPINEDGSYGPQTEARLAKSPVGGFPKGATCEQLDAGVDAGDPEPEPSAPAETSDPPEDEPAPEAPTTARELPSGDSQGCAAAPRAGESDAGAAVRGTLFAGALVALAALRRRRERGSAGARDRT